MIFLSLSSSQFQNPFQVSHSPANQIVLFIVLALIYNLMGFRNSASHFSVCALKLNVIITVVSVLGLVLFPVGDF